MFKDGVLGILPAEDFINTGWTPTRPAADPSNLLFGDEATDNIVARWDLLASQYMIPVMAQFHAFDTEARTRVRVPIDSKTVEKGLIKEKANTSELLRQAIKNGVERSNEAALYDYVFNDALNLAESVVTRANVAKNELLATGQVTIKENDLNLTVDYGVPQANTSLTLDFGAGATSDIPTQLLAIRDAAKAQGQTITGMFTSSATVAKLRQDPAIQGLIYGNSGRGALVRNADLQTYLSEEFGITRVITNDEVYAKERHIDPTTQRPAQTTARYYPSNKATFFTSNANGQLGAGLWGTPPELDVNGIGGMDVQASSLNGYVYISQWTEKDPAVLWTKASTLFMPVLFNPYGLWVASVTETPGA